jgi:hypothetical protein
MARILSIYLCDAGFVDSPESVADEKINQVGCGVVAIGNW